MADRASDQRLTLVLGGTGKTGRRVVHRLAARDLPVRIGSRNGGVPFDWDDPETWAPALDGVQAVYVSYYPDLAVPGAPEVIRAFADLAVSRGVHRLVLLSGRGEPEAEDAEKQLRAVTEDWTVLRCSWFSQNFSEGHFLEPVRSGLVALPTGDVAEPFIDVDDIADVAAAVLTENGHSGRIYELTGPRLLTFADAIAEIAAATGREIDFLRVSPEEYAEALRTHGLPAPEIDLVTYLFTTVLDGRNAHLDDGVARVLGRPARDFADYARTTAATGVWSPYGN